jgi:branched-chain amino acid transport system permease protein
MHRPLNPATIGQKWTGLVLFGFLLLMPAFSQEYFLVILTEIAIMALAAMGLYVLMGPGGMVSFGHAAFFGGGAYTCALLVHHINSPMVLSLFLAPLATGLLALLIGWFSVRLSGVYLAMLTLAFAQICWSIVFQWSSVTGGDDGILGIWPSRWASTQTAFYYLTLLLCTGGILAIRHLIFSPFGYVLRACRDSALRVDAIGIDLRRHQWATFTIVGAFTGLAGGLYAFSKGSVFPDEIALSRSFDFLLMVLLGGIEALSGPVVGAAAFTWLHDQISRFPFWQLTLGLIFITLVVAFPNGLGGFWDRMIDRKKAVGLKTDP